MVYPLHPANLETINLPIGAMDVRAEDGVFQELRAAGVRVRRVSDTHLVLETPNGGDQMHITSHFRVDVKTDSGHGAGR